MEDDFMQDILGAKKTVDLLQAETKNRKTIREEDRIVRIEISQRLNKMLQINDLKLHLLEDVTKSSRFD